MQTDSASTPSRVVEYELPAQLDIRAVEQFFDRLRTIAEEADVAMIDASKVERITTPCVQIVLSLSKTLEENGGRLKLKAASDVFHNAFADLGLTHCIKQWSNA